MKRTGILIGVGVFLLLALLFGLYDLPIAQFFYHPENRVARAFEEGGLLICPIILALCLHTFLAFSKRKGVRWLHIPLIILMACCIFIFSGGFDSLWQEGILLAVYLAFLLSLLLTPWQEEQKKTLLLIAKTTILASITLLLLCSMLKILAGRIRFRDMESLSEFTPWYVFHPSLVHKSFPSGHTANACSVFGFCYLALIFKNRLMKILCVLLPCALVLSMAITRMMMGAHYASDVLFSIGMACVLFPLSFHLVKKYTG